MMRTITFATFLFFSFAGFSQNMRVASFKPMPDDMEARLHFEKTPDDDPCILIKLVTPYKGFDIEVGGAILCKVDPSKTGEVWLWVSPNVRKLRIKHNELGVMDYRIPIRIEKKTVYELRLKTDKIITMVTPSLPSFIVINSTPTDANVFIDGKATGFKTTMQKSLPPGKHRIRIENPWYEPIEKVVNLTEGVTEELNLTFKRPLFGTLNITTSDNTDIYIDEQKMGTGTLSQKLMAGSYFIQLKKAGHFPQSFNVQIEKGKTQRLQKALIAQETALVLTSQPIGASVSLDGVVIGKTPLAKRVAVGSYELSLSKAGYQPHTERIGLIYGKRFDKALTLKKGVVKWDKTFGGEYEDKARSLIQTTDGGYAMGGYTDIKAAGYPTGYKEFLLVKVDRKGNKQWDKLIRGSDVYERYSLIQTTDGGYAMAGTNWRKGADDADFWLAKLDSNGNKQWDKTFGGNNHDVANSLIQTTDGGYAMAGYTIDADGSELWLVKVNSKGNKQWDKTFDGGYYAGANSLIKTTDGGYAMAGWTNSSGHNYNLWLVKVDSKGNKQWDNTFGGRYDEVGNSLIQTTDGGYAMAGFTESKGAGEKDFWLVKVDSKGNKQWDKTFGGRSDEVANSLIQTTDGGYAMAGSNMSKGAGGRDFWLVKVNSKGNKQWDKTFVGEYDEEANSLIQTTDGGYAMAGWTNSKGAGGKDFWVVKVDENGNLKH